jgi:hypothetical protein
MTRDAEALKKKPGQSKENAGKVDAIPAVLFFAQRSQR